MSAFIDTIVTISILLLLMLVMWSKVMKQTMLDTINELKEMFLGDVDE